MNVSVGNYKKEKSSTKNYFLEDEIMASPCFKKLGENQRLEKEKVYEIPEGATHVGFWDGRINFFKSDSKDCYRGQKWRFFFLGPMKQGCQYGISFPTYHFLNSSNHPGDGGLKKFYGHNYGRSAIISFNGKSEPKNGNSQPDEKKEEPIVAEP